MYSTDILNNNKRGSNSYIDRIIIYMENSWNCSHED